MRHAKHPVQPNAAPSKIALLTIYVAMIIAVCAIVIVNPR